MAAICFNDYESDILEQPYLNQYVFNIDIDEDTKDKFDIDYKEDEFYYFRCECLFNEDFTKCKVNAFITYGDEKQSLELSEYEQETFVELINHFRIFNEEEITKPILE